MRYEIYKRGDTLNRTTPKLMQHLPEGWQRRTVHRKAFSEIENWLGIELSRYRLLDGKEGTPTEQKAELKRYIEATKRTIHYISNIESLPSAIDGLLADAEYDHGWSRQQNEELLRLLRRKLIFAESVATQIQGTKGRAGRKKQGARKRLQAELAEKLREVGLSLAEADQSADSILKDKEALG